MRAIDPTVLAAIITAIATIVGVLIAYFIAGSKRRREKEAELYGEEKQRSLEAYRKFSALLKPTAEHGAPEEKIVIREKKQAYINAPVARAFFAALRDFVYSDYGPYLSQKMRQKVIPESRDYIFGLIEDATPDEKGWVPISNNKARKAQNALNWIRHTVLTEGGGGNLEPPGKILK